MAKKQKTGRGVSLAEAEEKPTAGALPPKDSMALFIRNVGRALGEGATAIHAGPTFDEPTQRCVSRIEYRIDGRLRERELVSDDDCRDFLSRVKQLSNLDPAEARLPQDGRMMLSIAGREVDLLVSLAPTALGERLCLRLFEHGEMRKDLSGLGVPQEAQDAARRWMARPWGLVVVCGSPSTPQRGLYYSLLSEARGRGHVASVEDPVESTFPGVTQIQADPRVGLTAARAIRAAMRQDPNVLGIGDVREPEEAELAVEAALTGHVVVAQVAASDAAAALARLATWVFDTESLARSLAGVLVRSLDGDGKVSYRAVDATDAIRAGLLERRSVAGLRDATRA